MDANGDDADGSLVATAPVRADTDEDVENAIFSDVSKPAYYYDAVLWAVDEGVTSGYTDGTFQPNTTANRAALPLRPSCGVPLANLNPPCTRGQIVTFMYRYFG